MIDRIFLQRINRIFVWVFYLIPGAIFVFSKSLIIGVTQGTCSDCGSKLVEDNERYFCPYCERKTKTTTDELIKREEYGN